MKKLLFLLLILSGYAQAAVIEISTASGNIGIGSITPGAKLDIVGGVRATTVNGVTFSGSTGTGANLVTSTGSVITGNGGKWDASGNWVDSGSAYNAGGGGLSGLTIGKLQKALTTSTIGDSQIQEVSGNIGVGTSNPGKTVDVTGDVRVSGKFYGDGSALTGISGSVSGLTANNVPKASGATTLTPGTITDTGNIGIGSTVPSAKLDVVGAGQFSQGVNLTGSGALTATTANGFTLDPNHASFTTGLFNVNTSGNVGVGTVTTPNVLTVAGTVQSTGFKMTTSPTNGYVLTSDASGNGSWTVSSGGGSGTVASSTIGQVPIYTGATTVTGNSGFVVDSGGNIGVGTTVPSNYLLTNTGDKSIVSVGNGTERFEAIYSGTYGATGGGRIILGSDNGAALTNGSRLGAFVFGGATDTSRSGGSFGLSSAVTAFAEENFSGSTSTSDIRFETGSTGGGGRTARLFVKGGGNVGIGSSTPNGIVGGGTQLNIQDNSSTGLLGIRVGSTTGTPHIRLAGNTTIKTPGLSIQDNSSGVDVDMGGVYVDRTTPITTGAARNDLILGSSTGATKLDIATNGTVRIIISNTGAITLGTGASHVSTGYCGTSAGTLGYCSGGLAAVCGTCTAL